MCLGTQLSEIRGGGSEWPLDYQHSQEEDIQEKLDSVPDKNLIFMGFAARAGAAQSPWRLNLQNLWQPLGAVRFHNIFWVEPSFVFCENQTFSIESKIKMETLKQFNINCNMFVSSDRSSLRRGMVLHMIRKQPPTFWDFLHLCIYTKWCWWESTLHMSKRIHVPGTC